MNIPRNEYPRPQFRRDEWLCLNGKWQFEIDHGDSGIERGLQNKPLSGSITVPFCPESELSGVGYTDYMNAVWYRREITIPAAWVGKKVLLHFQACDYDTTVWINGQRLGNHRGGFTPFSFELNQYVKPGETAVISVLARDYGYEHKAGGKQNLDYPLPAGCLYLRTTGIWQSVWLEAVGPTYLKRPRITPDLHSRSFLVEQPLCGRREPGQVLCAVLSDKDGEVCSAEVCADLDFTPSVRLEIPEGRLRLWQPGKTFLYDLRLELRNAAGELIDYADSYAGMRSISFNGRKVLINGKPVFQRQVLDQGYYRDGIMTAPSDAALIKDIELSMAAGFNSARLHQKVFEERFLYHADRLGYLVWGEFGDWGAHRSEPHYGKGQFRDPSPWEHFAHNAMFQQWCEALERDYNHPSIIGWCPLNETHRNVTDRIDSLDDLTRGLFLVTKAMDLTRPVLDTSGYCHRVPETDIYDSHNYEQDPAKLAEAYAGLADGQPYYNNPQHWLQSPYAGQPYFCSEFGGIKWCPEQADSAASWGYGQTPKSLEEFYARFAGLCKVLLDNPDMFGYCYTQLTDVFQEQNGIYFFDRSSKFDMAKIRAAQTIPAACEKE